MYCMHASFASVGKLDEALPLWACLTTLRAFFCRRPASLLSRLGGGVSPPFLIRLIPPPRRNREISLRRIPLLLRIPPHDEWRLGMDLEEAFLSLPFLGRPPPPHYSPSPPPRCLPLHVVPTLAHLFRAGSPPWIPPFIYILALRARLSHRPPSSRRKRKIEEGERPTRPFPRATSLQRKVPSYVLGTVEYIPSPPFRGEPCEKRRPGFRSEKNGRASLPPSSHSRESASECS